jgi:hypothetical protein
MRRVPAPRPQMGGFGTWTDQAAGWRARPWDRCPTSRQEPPMRMHPTAAVVTDQPDGCGVDCLVVNGGPTQARAVGAAPPPPSAQRPDLNHRASAVAGGTD